MTKRSLLAALACIACGGAHAGPSIGTLYPSANPGVNRRFELTFTITDIQPHGEFFPSDGNFGYNPFWPDTTASGPLPTAPGVKVWADITVPNGYTFTLTGFWCVEYQYLGDTMSGYDRIVPVNHPQTGTAEHWHVRFIPTMTGTYHVTVYADDPDPTTPPSSASTSFVVWGRAPWDRGILKVSSDGERMEYADGTAYCQLGFEMPQGCQPVAHYPALNGRKGLEILADAGGNFVRRWLVNTSREDIYRGISWHRGSGETYSNTVARRGSRSRVLTGGSSTVTAVDRSFLGCRPNRTYTASIWAKCEPGSTGRIRMRVNESNGANNIERKSSSVSVTDQEWTQVSLTLTTAADSKWLHFKPQLEGGSAGTFYLDDMDLRETTPGSEVDWNMIQNPSFEQWTPIQLDIANLWRGEYCLRQCEQLGIKAQYTLFDYKLWSYTAPVGFYSQWFSTGFWGDMSTGAWTENDTVRQEKRVLRYLAARYGGFPSLGLWELTNEMSPDYAQVAYDWQRNMSEYLRSIDLGYGGMPSQRPVTNSFWSSPASTVSYDRIPGMQVCSAHAYAYTDTRPDRLYRVPGWWIDANNIDSTDYHSYPNAYHQNLDYGSEVKDDTLIALRVGIRPNKLYKFRYWFRTGAVTGSKPMISGSCYRHDAFGQGVKTLETLANPSPVWVEREVSWTSGPSEADVDLLLGLDHVRTIEIWFDDMELLESDDGVNWRSIIYNSDLTITDMGDDELVWALYINHKFDNAYSAGPYENRKAWIFGESGLFDWSPSRQSWVFSSFADADVQGIHTHNMVWAQTMASGALNTPLYWFSSEYMLAKAAAGIDVYAPTWKGVSEFIKVLPFRTGGERISSVPFFSKAPGVVSSDSSIRLVGWKRENSAYFWVSNATNTWANRIQRGNAPTPRTATLSIPGFVAEDYTLANYDSHTGALISSQLVPIEQDGVLQVRVNDLSTDTAFIVIPYDPPRVHPLSLPDAASVEMLEMVVTSGSRDEPGVYVEASSRAWGIRLIPPEGTSVARGDVVRVSGTMRTEDGERRIEVSPEGLTVLSQGEPLRPIALTNRSLGGRSASQYVPAIKYGAGLYNVGLLVTCWGEVLSIGEGFFEIDDGQGLQTGSGIRVGTTQAPADLEIGDYVVVTGISSTARIGDEIVRCLRPRDTSDIVIHPE